MQNLIEILGLTAGVCTTFSVIPQIKKILQTKSAKDISYLMYITNCVGFILWIIYGTFIGSLSLICANVITLILQASVLIMKFRWEGLA